jgi:hypothetical protein
MATRSILFVLVTSLGAVCIGKVYAQHRPPNISQNEPAAFSVTISSPPVIKSGTEAQIKIDLTNTSNHEIRLNSSNGLSGIGEIVIRNENGDSPLSRRGRNVAGGNDLLVGSDHSVPVSPGKALTERVVIPKTYDIGQPGRYTVQVQKHDPYSGTVVKSNTITITVTP